MTAAYHATPRSGAGRALCRMVPPTFDRAVTQATPSSPIRVDIAQAQQRAYVDARAARGVEGGNRQAVAAGGYAPGGLLVEQRIRLCKVITRRLDPEAQLVEQREGMVGTVCDEQNGAVEILM